MPLRILLRSYRTIVTHQLHHLLCLFYTKKIRGVTRNVCRGEVKEIYPRCLLLYLTICIRPLCRVAHPPIRLPASAYDNILHNFAVRVVTQVIYAVYGLFVGQVHLRMHGVPMWSFPPKSVPGSAPVSFS